MPTADPSAPPAPDSLRAIVDSLTADAEQLIRAELRLARAEALATLRRAGWLLGGAVLAFVGVGYLVGFGLAILIAWRGNHTLVAGIIAGAFLLLVLTGASVVWVNRRLAPLPLTRASLREDLEWARAQTKRARP